MDTFIPFNRPPLTGRELEFVREALEQRQLAGGESGYFTTRSQAYLRGLLGVPEVLLTHSCTAALEMAALLCDLEAGDEVIMPSFTFVSTANAVVLRGAKPVFVDIRPDTLNIDEAAIEAAITPRTKAIFVVHYAGIPAEMDEICRIAARHNLLVVEDAAQALLSEYHGRPAGALGDMSCVSFHATKNVVSGEGGALALTRKDLVERAHVIWEKGTNRRRFLAGEVDKYTWVDAGSSFLPSEITAAILYAQLLEAKRLTEERLQTWNTYHAAFADIEARGHVKRPTVPPHVTHNGHIYYLLLADPAERSRVIQDLKKRGLAAPFHYVPLHSAPAGLRYGVTSGDLTVTDDLAARLIRLPLWTGIGEAAHRVVEEVLATLDTKR